MTIFFTADSHWSHANIIKYCNRPFMTEEEQAIVNRHLSCAPDDPRYEECRKAYTDLRISRETIKKHDEMLITNWNKVVGDKDTVYHLGDFGFFKESQQAGAILDRLKGKLVLLKGSHDKRPLFDAIRHRRNLQHYHPPSDLEITIDGMVVHMAHHAHRVWTKSHYGSIHLYGHSHGGLPPREGQRELDVGVDCWNFTPVSWEQIKEAIEKVPWVSPFEPRK